MMRRSEVLETLKRSLPWLIRALIAWVLIGALVPAQPRAPLGDPQTVETTEPQSVCTPG